MLEQQCKYTLELLNLLSKQSGSRTQCQDGEEAGGGVQDPEGHPPGHAGQLEDGQGPAAAPLGDLGQRRQKPQEARPY